MGAISPPLKSVKLYSHTIHSPWVMVIHYLLLGVRFPYQAELIGTSRTMVHMELMTLHL